VQARTLKQFLIECANYHQGECRIQDTVCIILTGERCDYFERSVLGPPDYRYPIPDVDYPAIRAQYADQTGAKIEKSRQRLCQCGNPLLPRQRLCGNCRRKSRKSTMREYQRKYRSQRNTVNENGKF